MQRTGAHLHIEFATDFVLYFHPPACSIGKTPLKLAIDQNKPDVIAFLRIVGAQE
jgi:hypothetical protein